jgi:hypothetical protein
MEIPGRAGRRGQWRHDSSPLRTRSFDLPELLQNPQVNRRRAEQAAGKRPCDPGGHGVLARQEQAGNRCPDAERTRLHAVRSMCSGFKDGNRCRCLSSNLNYYLPCMRV